MMSKNSEFNFFKNKLCKKNKTEIGNKNKNKLRTISDWKVQNQKIIYYY